MWVFLRWGTPPILPLKQDFPSYESRLNVGKWPSWTVGHGFAQRQFAPLGAMKFFFVVQSWANDAMISTGCRWDSVRFHGKYHGVTGIDLRLFRGKHDDTQHFSCPMGSCPVSPCGTQYLGKMLLPSGLAIGLSEKIVNIESERCPRIICSKLKMILISPAQYTY